MAPFQVCSISRTCTFTTQVTHVSGNDYWMLAWVQCDRTLLTICSCKFRIRLSRSFHNISLVFLRRAVNFDTQLHIHTQTHISESECNSVVTVYSETEAEGEDQGSRPRPRCGAVSLRCDATQRDGAARARLPWVMHSIECSASRCKVILCCTCKRGGI